MGIVETDRPSPRPSRRLRPELTWLDPEQKAAIQTRLERRKVTCGDCGNQDFTVGDALYLGFLFLSEPLDSYMVALTCNNPRCARPRTGIRLKSTDFLQKA